MRQRQVFRRLAVLAALAALAACQPEQSALHPAGTEARHVAWLIQITTLGAAAIWLAVMGIAAYAAGGRNRPTSDRFADRFILACGVVFPTAVLVVLLVFGLRLLPDWQGRPDLRIHVTAEQFWWRIAYELPDGRLVETANELHLPRGQVAEFAVTAQDVIHSFWIPPLGGKIDAIPGRTTLLRLTPEVTGRFRGVCAEYCGLSHALMALPVTVSEPADFARWLEAEAMPAARGDPAAFRRAGCGACHAVRGVVEEGSVGPDLTHLARRGTLAAGTLPLTEQTLAAWIANPAAFKPGVRMPGYADLPEAEIRAVLAFLMELR